MTPSRQCQAIRRGKRAPLSPFRVLLLPKVPPYLTSPQDHEVLPHQVSCTATAKIPPHPEMPARDQVQIAAVGSPGSGQGYGHLLTKIDGFGDLFSSGECACFCPRHHIVHKYHETTLERFDQAIMSRHRWPQVPQGCSTRL